MVKKNEFELWSTIKERLSPPDLKTFVSLSRDFNHRRIVKTQLIDSALLLFKNDEFLHRCFTDFLQEVYVRNTESTTNTEESGRNVQEAAMAYDVGQEEDVVICKNVCKLFSEILSPSEFLKLISSIKDFDKQKISQSEFRKSLGLLYESKGQDQDEHGKAKQDVEDTDLEEGEIRENRLLLRDTKVEKAESNRLATRAEVDERAKEDPKIGADVEVRVSDERELEKHVTNGFNKMNLEGKKRRILQPEPIERSPKKRRASRRLQGVTPTYKLMTEEEQCPVKYKVLNNERLLKQLDDPSGHKTLTDYEEAVARCEDDMYEANMLMEALKSAVEEAEKVMREEMSVEDLGVMFYTCIEMLYGGDMFETVKVHNKLMLPILRRLKQKQVEVEAALEKWKPIWKNVIKENTEKQRDSTETRSQERVKENSKVIKEDPLKQGRGRMKKLSKITNSASDFRRREM